MDTVCRVKLDEKSDENSGDIQSDVVQQKEARASNGDSRATTTSNDDVVPELPRKKRKTRRGKSKRKHPYVKNNNKNLRKITDKLIKPEAPHNSNEFLLEDHALVEELDENLRVTPSTTLRTRDSSFSIDTDGDEFYSSPEDEEEFLIKDFCDQYESLYDERLQAMTKAELIQEYLILQSKYDQISKKLTEETNQPDLEKEIEKLKAENEQLRRDNEALKSECNRQLDSEDSETDSSSSSCSSSSSSSSNCSSSRSRSPINASTNVDYTQTNGHDVQNELET